MTPSRELLLHAAAALRDAVNPFAGAQSNDQVAYILNPLDYAWNLHRAYLEQFGDRSERIEAVFVGMNPGPFGMGQTAVPFGSPDMVRNFLKLSATIQTPALFHHKRPVLGLSCPTNEVSGQRFWGAIQECFGTPDAFFARFFVVNFCPLLFQNSSGANVTPDKLDRTLRGQVLPSCFAHLITVLSVLRPATVIGVGTWAAARCREAVKLMGATMAVEAILHPSPASPAANRGWARQACQQLAAMGHPWPNPPHER